MRTHALAIASGLAALLIATEAGAQSQCYGNINAQPYVSGFTPAVFSANNNVQTGTSLKLDTNLNPIDPNNIKLPFSQKLTVDYVYESAGASHTFGWMFLDQFASYFNSDGTLVDPTGAALAQAIYQRDAGSNPDFTRSSKTYSDGGTWAHFPNYLESRSSTIFKLCDDDTDTTVFGANYAPVTDASSTNDGVPDYDVNGDGVINVADRTVDLGTVQGNREIIFFLVVYYDQTVKHRALGLTATPDSTILSKTIVFFSKHAMNPDRGVLGNNTQVTKIDIGCDYPNSCAGITGWLDAATLARLNTPAYGNISLPHEAVTVKTSAAGDMPHLILGAPTTYPNLWLLGWEDLVNYDNTSCSGCTQGDRDYNDLVFLVRRQNGGSVQSQSLSTDIPAAVRADTVIHRVKIKKQETIPIPPCTAAPTTRIDYYYSIDGGVTWRPVTFPATSPNEVTISLLGAGVSGTDLRWRADIISPSENCQPQINKLDIGYEAVVHGTYSQSSPVPLANLFYRGGFETPAATWVTSGTPADFRYRGHFGAYRRYDPDNPSIDTSNLLWDAGAQLAAKNPDTRKIYTAMPYTPCPVADQGPSGTCRLSLTTANTMLNSQLIDSAACSEMYNGKPIFDVDGNNVCDATDAQLLMQWTRGWETPGVQRAWKLGPVIHSSAAAVGPPGIPSWYVGTRVPSAEKDEFRIWAADPLRAQRRTVAFVGSQTGMVHAFDAGQYRYGDDPATTSIKEQRGYFNRVSGTPDYGTGAENYAYVPKNMLKYLRHSWALNKVPITTGEQPAIDAALTAADVKIGSTFKTVLAMNMGFAHPWLHAIDVTTATEPKEIWAAPWTDTDFQGSRSSPAIVRLQLGATNTYWAILTSSGIADVPSNVFLYAIDATTGQTIANGKVPLNNPAGPPGVSETAYGIEGHILPYDSDADGYVDRVYAVDTNGRLWKWDTVSQQVCLLASVGRPVYSAPTIVPPPEGTLGGSVAIFFASGDDPERNDATGTNYIYGYADAAQPGSCTSADVTEVYKQPIKAGEKVWADPFSSDDAVYFASAGTDRSDICLAGGASGGSVYQVQANNNGAPQSVALVGNAAAGIFVTDQKVLVNTVGGKTVIYGTQNQNNNQVKAKSVNTPMKDEAWNELGATK